MSFKLYFITRECVLNKQKYALFSGLSENSQNLVTVVKMFSSISLILEGFVPFFLLLFLFVYISLLLSMK